MSFGSLSLKGKALRCLSQREHSRAELQTKLLHHAIQALRKGMAPRAGSAATATATATAAAAAAADDADADAHSQKALQKRAIEKVLDDLAAAGLQSDTRAAESLARTKSSRYGEHRLRQQLQAKGLDSELVAYTVGQTRATEFERAQDLWRRRFGEPTQDLAERARQTRFLAARGFDSDVIRRVVRGPEDRD